MSHWTPPSALWRYPGPDLRLPRWTVARALASGMTYELLQHPAQAMGPFLERTDRAGLARWLPRTPPGEPRQEWILPAAFPPGTDLAIAVTVTVTGAVRTIAPRRAISAADRDTAPEPTFYLDPVTRQLSLRNLFMRAAEAQSGDGVYTITGETDGLVPDTGIYWRTYPTQPWRWLSPESETASGATFQLPVSGAVFLSYGSQALLTALPSGTARVTSPFGLSVRLPLIARPLPNRIDGWGELIGLPRFRDEDDRAYKARQVRYLLVGAGTERPIASLRIAAQLGLLSQFLWSGTGPLVIDPTGASGFTEVIVAGVPRLLTVQEELLPLGDGLTYAASHAGWKRGYLVTAGGIPAAGASLSGSLVTFVHAPSGRVAAQYTVERWREQRLATGTIGTIVAGTGMPSGAYNVLASRAVTLLSPDLPQVQTDHLLLPNEQPNGLFRALAETLAARSTRTIGRARWGLGEWLDPGDGLRPDQMARLPVPFDRASGSV
jgi:hypothetical protein